MDLETQISFEADISIPDAEKDISEAKVFMYDAENGPDNFFLSLYIGMDGVNHASHVQRITGADREEYEELIDQLLENPEFLDGPNGSVYARSGDSGISWDPIAEGGVLTYHGNLSEGSLKELYVGDSEPLSKAEYEDAIETALTDVREVLYDNDVEPFQRSP